MGSIDDSTVRKSITTPQIEDLRGELKSSQLLSAESPDFADSLKRWSLAAVRPAGAVLLAESVDDISKTVAYCSKNNLDIAVRGGGHSTAGASSTDGGVVIDLSKMREVTVDAAAKTITAQGGCLWSDVDKASTKHGLATVGGTVDHTGVGGLTLGGGYGWTSGIWGLTCDNLLSATIVIADGSVVTCSEKENPDLFWAVRGAGQNFGVAVSFTFQAYEKTHVWAGLLAFPLPLLEQVVEAVNSLFPNGNLDHGKGSTGIGVGCPPPAFQPVVLCPVFYDTSSAAEAEAAFAPLLSLGPVHNTAAVVPYEVLNALLPSPHGLRVSMKGASFTLPIRPAFARARFSAYLDFLAAVPDAGASMLIFECIDPSKICSIPQSATAFANRGMHMNAMVGPMWSDPANDAVCRQWARDQAAAFEDELAASVKRGVDPERNGVMIYGNYDQYEEKSRDIFGSNYERLTKLKAQYDPGNLFNKLFAITPAAHA